MKRSSCPICGRGIEGTTDLALAMAYRSHRCPERTLAAIDGAHRRDSDADICRDWPREPMRLVAGLAMLQWGERDDPRVW